jgi:hypothetical protein
MVPALNQDPVVLAGYGISRVNLAGNSSNGPRLQDMPVFYSAVASVSAQKIVVELLLYFF